MASKIQTNSVSSDDMQDYIQRVSGGDWDEGARKGIFDKQSDSESAKEANSEDASQGNFNKEVAGILDSQQVINEQQNDRINQHEARLDRQSSKIDDVSHSVDEFRAETERQFRDLQNYYDQQFAKLQAETNSRFDEIQRNLERQIASIGGQINSVADTDVEKRHTEEDSGRHSVDDGAVGKEKSW